MDRDGHGAFGLRAFPLRPQHKGKGGKYSDRDDGRADEGVRYFEEAAAPR